MLRKIALKYHKSATTSAKVLIFIAIILLGVLLGYISEWLEYGIYHTEHNILNYHNNILLGFALVLNYFSVWIFCATLISYFSWGPISAGIHTFSFLLSMCIAYFIPKHTHYGYPINTQLLFWSLAAFLSIVAAVLIWYSKVGGLYGAIIKALPISAVLIESIYVIYKRIRYYTPPPGSPARPFRWLLQTEWTLFLGIYITFMIILLFSLSKSAKERLRIAFLSISLAAVLSALIIFIL